MIKMDEVNLSRDLRIYDSATEKVFCTKAYNEDANDGEAFAKIFYRNVSARFFEDFLFELNRLNDSIKMREVKR